MSSSSSTLPVAIPRLSNLRACLPRPRSIVAGVVIATILLFVGSTYVHLEVPAPTGEFAVGRESVSWVDVDRPEEHTPLVSDLREIPALVWYPAVADTGEPAEYVPGLSRLRDSLVESGEINGLEATGLALVRDPARDSARISPEVDSYPLIILSPGHMTNVSFYASLAEELASHGYIVVGLDHPYSVAATQLEDGSVATADADGLPPDMVVADVSTRVADIRFVLDRISQDSPSFLQKRVDLDSVAVMGHSLGGVAAAEACSADERLVACLNIDGQQAGGPFSTDPEGAVPQQAFMYLTKEATLHPEIAERFESAGEGAYMAVMPSASHQNFADGSLFEPSLVPWARARDDVMTTARGIVVRFFDHALRGEVVGHLGGAPAPAELFLNVFPLGDKPTLPDGGA